VTSRRVAGALAVGLAYMALAALSGWISPIARRPILDGIGPVAPYRWVSPPPELAVGNQPPAAGDFEIRLSREGSDPGVFITADNQVTVVVDRGAFAPIDDDRTVRLRVTPVDPATLGTLPGELTAFGNALEIRASSQPSGKPIRRLAQPLRMVLIYPVTQDLHAATHGLQHSTDGQAWTALDSQDAPALQQVEASVVRLGIVVVAGELTPNPITSTAPVEDTNPLVVVLLVASAGALLAGVALIIRGRSVR